MEWHAVTKARMGNPETELCRSLNNVPYSSTLLALWWSSLLISIVWLDSPWLVHLDDFTVYVDRYSEAHHPHVSAR
jgi:hypothetical protein